MQLSEENETLKKNVIEIKRDLNSVQQYLRVDNIEIVGLPPPTESQTDENLLVEALQSLELEDHAPLTKEHIDICHEVPSQRRDGKRVVVCKFLSCIHADL